ncbi:hypothetical protein C1I95_28260 [Micromonospora craterilacus]|uniref:Tetratricopeptide repeat protein n=2 Tax=Micromonospora craterilacus TaxID=1655439 RepID=A0A2W2F224_9ACTN|nr:hypothetical protein C1I95_28260 [Micromonospora craterilacus]
MTQGGPPGVDPTYECRPGCRPTPPAAAAVAATVGAAILRYAPQLAPVTGTPTPPILAAAHADRILARVTVGTTAADITLAWHARPAPSPGPLRTAQAHRVAMARHVAAADPQRALSLLYNSLTEVNPATAPADVIHADAAALLATVHLTLGHAKAAVTWATYAHHALAHLKGPSHRDSLASLHLLATAHRSAGHHQRALHLYQQLADHLTTTDGPHAHRTLAIRATISLVLHHLGHCQAARTLLADTITTHQREHPDHPATSRMTQHLTRIRIDCDTKRHQHTGSARPPI